MGESKLRFITTYTVIIVSNLGFRVSKRVPKNQSVYVSKPTARYPVAHPKRERLRVRNDRVDISCSIFC